MIFLSHTHKDKRLIEPIAEKLAEVFGKEKVFYDSWSIQPGDGIIDKMSEGLSKCEFFFFFVSKHSLQSKMVSLEWQNALLKSTRENTNIIPVKIDDCMMPDVLLQTLYIDFYGQGPENALRQMIDVITGQNTYRPSDGKGFQNVRAYIEWEGENLIIEFNAEAYMEPHSRYLILLDNEKSELKWTCPREGMHQSGFHEEIKLNDGRIHNALSIGRQTPTTPGFPFVVKLEPQNNSKINFQGAMRAVSDQQFSGVPIIEKQS